MCIGEDVPDELKAQERGQWQWRLGCMGRPLAGAALEESAEELKGIANFEGAASACLLTTAVVASCMTSSWRSRMCMNWKRHVSEAAFAQLMPIVDISTLIVTKYCCRAADAKLQLHNKCKPCIAVICYPTACL